MARNRGTNHRRRRGRFSFLLRLVCSLLILGAVIAALTVFFKVQRIEVNGSERYDAQTVVEASGIEPEDNLFLLNKYSVGQTICETLPYVEAVSIRRALPDTIVITVQECGAAAGLETQDGVWLISENGKLLERADAAGEGRPTVVGIELTAPEPSAQLAPDGESSEEITVLLTLLRTAGERAMLADLGRIDLSDPEAIYLRYLDRFTVKLPWDADIATVLRGMEEVVTEKLESNQTGEINFMNLADKGQINFIPDK